MKLKDYYIFNEETCTYEKVSSFGTRIKERIIYLAVFLALGFGTFFAYNKFFNGLANGQNKNSYSNPTLSTKKYFNDLKSELERLNQIVTFLEVRDDHMYRAIFEVESIPKEVRSVGIGGIKQRTTLPTQNSEWRQKIQENRKKVDQLKRRIYVQSKSYQNLSTHLKQWQDKINAMPCIQPVDNKDLTRLASGFGMRIHPIYKVKRRHNGCDFAAPLGTSVYATGKGKVISVGWKVGYGKTIDIDHGYGFVTRYAHLSKYFVKEGQRIKRSDVIGLVGNTGASLAPHVHYEIHKNGIAVDPKHYFFRQITPKEYEKLESMSELQNQSMD